MSSTAKSTKTKNDNQPQPPTNMTALRDELLVLFAAIGTSEVSLSVAKEKSNAAGKIIKSASTQLEYAIARKEKPRIPFMK